MSNALAARLKRQGPQRDAGGCLVPTKPPPPIPVKTIADTRDDAGLNWDLRGSTDYVEIYRGELKARWRAGVIEILGNIADDPAGVGVTYQYAIIEYRVIGSVGPASRILKRGVLGGQSGNALYLVQLAERYSYLTVEARKVMDGAIGSSVSPLQMSASVLARYVSEG